MVSGNDVLALLNWSDNEKNMCAKNIRTAFRVAVPFGAEARMWTKRCDKTEPRIGYVAVMDRGSSELNSEGRKFGHVGVVTDIDERAKKVRIFDGPNAYHIWVSKRWIAGYISPEKMVKLGSKINFNEPKPTMTMGEYEKIYKTRYPRGGTIYKNLDAAAAKFGDIAYFVAIGAERAAGK